MFSGGEPTLQGADLAGILFFRGAGAVSSSSISGGLYPVVATVGSDPVLADDNELSGSESNGLEWGNFDPAPSPAPGMPVNPFEPR